MDSHALLCLAFLAIPLWSPLWGPTYLTRPTVRTVRDLGSICQVSAVVVWNFMLFFFFTSYLIYPIFKALIYYSKLLFKIFLMFILFLRQRDTEHKRGWGRGRDTENPKQAPGSKLSAQSPTEGSNSSTSRLWPEPKSDTQPTEPPRRPYSKLSTSASSPCLDPIQFLLSSISVNQMMSRHLLLLRKFECLKGNSSSFEPSENSLTFYPVAQAWNLEKILFFLISTFSRLPNFLDSAS